MTDPAAQDKKERKRRGWTAVLAVVAGVLLLALVLLVSFLDTAPARNLLLSRINGLIPGTLTAESHRVFLWRGELLARGLTLRAPGGEEVARIEDLELGISWFDLLGRFVLAVRLKAHAPRFNLVFDKDGSSNLTKALLSPVADRGRAGSPSSLAAFPPVLLRFEAAGGSLHASFPGGPVFDLKGIGMNGRAGLPGREGALGAVVETGSVLAGDLSMPLARSEIRAELSKGNLEGIAGDLHGGPFSLSFTGAVGDLLGDPRPDLEFRFSGSLGGAADLFRIAGGMSGDAVLAGRIGGTLDNPAGDVRGEIGPASFRGISIEGGRFALSLEERVLSLSSLEAALPGGRLAFTGKADLRKALPRGLRGGGDLSAVAYEAAWEGEGIVLEAFPFLDGLVSGSLDGRGSLAGKGFAPATAELSFQAEGEGKSVATPSVEGVSDVRFDAAGAWKRGTLTLSRAVASDGNVSLRGQGWLSTEESAFGGKLAAAAGDLARVPVLSRLVPVGGSCDLTVTVSGSLREPSFALSGKGRRLRYGAYSMGDGAVEGTMGPDGTAEISQLTLRNGGSRLSLSGRAALFRRGLRERNGDPAFRLDLKADPVFLQDVDPSLRGTASLDAALEGTWSAPRGKIRVRGGDLELPGQRIAAVAADLTLREGRIVVDTLTVSPREGETVRASGWFVPGGAYEGSLSTAGVSLEGIGWIAGRLPVKGKAALDLAGRGEMRNPAFKGTIALRDLFVSDRLAGDFSFLAEYRDGTAAVEGLDGLPLSARFNRASGDFSLSLSPSGEDLAPWFTLFRAPLWGGEVSAKVLVKGNARDPEKIDGEIGISRIAVNHEDVRVASADHLEAAIRRGVLILSPGRVRILDGGEVRFEGKGGLSGPLDFRLDGSIPLAAAGPFASGLSDFQGRADFSGTVGGTVDHPDFRGEILLEGLGMTVLSLSERIRDVRGSIEIAGERILFREVRGFLEDGPFRMEGSLDFREFKPEKADLRLEGRNLPFVLPDTLQAIFSGDLALRGTSRESVLSGSVTLVEGLYYKKLNKMDIDLRSLFAARRSVSPQRERKAVPFLENTALDVAIRRQGAFLVDNDLASLAAVPDLQLGGTWGKPVLSGRITIPSGTVTYRDRTFIITRGTLDFTDPREIDPVLDVAGRVQVREWRITLEVSGRTNNLKFVLSSDPAEEDQDILSLLLFGKTTRELTGGEGGTPSSPEEMLARLVASTLSGRVRELTGLDVFEVQPGSSGNGVPGSGFLLTVGKRLTRRFSIEYSVGTSDGEAVQEAAGEYRLLEDLLLRGFQNDRGVYGGEIQLRFEFR
ncbi:MAG TPA: translocation/assembly module TamB domain-containing protein [Syntrophales bacterium]|nr:translocation/assembly module TamB domain-containing protein [Syntrophales bacterium]HQN77353.1 translocation/assembly module TamB domain-containing protein [Syntrophales bacterium]